MNGKRSTSTASRKLVISSVCRFRGRNRQSDPVPKPAVGASPGPPAPAPGSAAVNLAAQPATNLREAVLLRLVLRRTLGLDLVGEQASVSGEHPGRDYFGAGLEGIGRNAVELGADHRGRARGSAGDLEAIA